MTCVTIPPNCCTLKRSRPGALPTGLFYFEESLITYNTKSSSLKRSLSNMDKVRSYHTNISLELLPSNLNTALNVITNSIRAKKLVFFLGAGLSLEYPSLLPLVMKSDLPGLKQLLIKILIHKVPDKLKRPLREELKNLTLEHILDQCSRILGDEALDFLNVLETNNSKHSPNYRHYFLALLAEHCLCHTFLTVNFDNLLESALNTLNIPLDVPEREDNEEHAYDTASNSLESKIHLFKLHGTLDKKPNLLTTVEKIGNGLPKYKSKMLKTLFQRYDIFFLGYSDNDIDVFPDIVDVVSNSNVFWYEHNYLRNRTILKFLANRQHHILIGDLDKILQIVLHRLNLDDTPILSRIGVSYLKEIKRVEFLALPQRRKEIYDFVNKYEKQFISNESANLILSNIISVDKIKVRQQLFNSVNPDKLSPELKYSYYAELAEKHYSDGTLSLAIENRKKAMKHLRSANFSPSSSLRKLLEQKSRLRGDYFSLLKKTYNFLALIPIALLSLEIRFRLLFHGHHLNSFDKGTIRSMFYFHAGSLCQTLVERLLLKRARDYSKQTHDLVFSLLTLLIRLFAGFAENRYRHAIELDRQSAGWNLLHLQRLAEVIMHRKQSCNKEAKELIEKTRKWGRTGETSKRPKEHLGPHEGLLLFYERNYSEAIRILNLTNKYYEKTKHLTGKIKTQLFLALCYWELSDKHLVRKSIEEYNELLKGYR